jgi:undecaprenyl-diphosphatase
VTQQIGWWEALVLGVVQGLTEFLPISSSAHLLVIAEFLGWPDPGAAFTAVSQIGTEIAVLIYFRKDLARILVAWTKSLRNPTWRADPDARLGWYIIIGSVPILVLGFLFASWIETAARNLWLIAGSLIIFGLLLGAADVWGSKVKRLDRLGTRDALVFGFGQALALIPGVSRSGATITTGLALGYTREAAARYSFLLAIPAIFASGLYEATKIGSDSAVAWGPTLFGTAVAFVIGYAVIAWLLRWVMTHSYSPFVIYRIVLGLLLIGLLSAGVLTSP